MGEPLRLPPVEWTHVLDWWEEIGIGRELSWVELDAWNRATGTDATYFELRALLDMHNSYMIQRTKTAPALSPPYDPRTEEEKNEALNKSFVNVFSQLPRAK